MAFNLSQLENWEGHGKWLTCENFKYILFHRRTQVCGAGLEIGDSFRSPGSTRMNSLGIHSRFCEISYPIELFLGLDQNGETSC